MGCVHIMACLHCRIRIPDSISNSDYKPKGYIKLGKTFHIAKTWIQIPIPAAKYMYGNGIGIRIQICICECK